MEYCLLLPYLPLTHSLSVQAGSPPLILQHYVATYPTLQLRNVPVFLNELGLTNTSFIDFWAGEWNIINVDTPLHVEKERDILLRLRPNLLSPIDDSDCPQLNQYLRGQLCRPKTKRLGDASLISPAKKRKVSTVYEAPIDSDSDVEIISSSGQGTSCTGSAVLHPTKHTRQKSSLGPSGLERKWPTDFTVSEIKNGLDEALRMPGTLKNTFPKIFGVQYVKPTVTRNKRILDECATEKGLRGLRDKFIAYGDSSQGLWPYFLRTIKTASGDEGLSASSSNEDGETPLDIQEIKKHASQQPRRRSSEPVSWTATIGEMLTISDDDLLAAALARSTVAAAQNDLEPFSIQQLLDEDHDPNSTLCDFCDEAITATPSRRLLKMGMKLRSESQKAPNLFNDNHRNHPGGFAVYQEYCSLHKLETILLPHAQISGWPKSPNFAQLHLRVFGLRQHLRDVLNDLDNNIFFKLAKKSYEKENGRQVDSIIGQFKAFTDESAG